MRFSRWSCLAVSLSIAAGPIWAQTPTVQETFDTTTAQLLLNARTGLRDYNSGGVNFTTADVFVSNADPLEELLGATLKPVDEVLRAQLVIPAGQGLLIASLRANGPSAETGLHKDDILLSLGAKPLASTDDLTKQLLAAGQSNVPLKVLRGGKPVTIQVRPEYKVTFGPVAKEQIEYYIGVGLEPIEDALRTQLGLSAGQGVVITDVVKGSAAEKAGLQKHDLALELGGKPVGTPEALAHQVQENRDTPSSLKLLRAGKVLTVPITGRVRKVQANLTTGNPEKIVTWLDAGNDLYVDRVNAKYAALSRRQQTERQTQLEHELKALNERVEKLIKLLEKTKPE